MFRSFEDEKRIKDTEKSNDQQSTLLVPTGTARESSVPVGKEISNHIASRKVPNVAKFERLKKCEKSLIQYKDVLATRDKILNTCKNWKPKKT